MKNEANIAARALTAWERYWFPNTTAAPLAIMRIILVALQLAWFFPPLYHQIELLEGNVSFFEPELITRFASAIVGGESLFRTTAFVTALWWGTWIVGLLALLGLLTRVTLFLFAVGTWVLIAHAYSYGEKHHPEAIYCIVLMMLAFAPAGRCFSLDAILFGKNKRSADAPVNEGWGPHARFTIAQWPLTATMWLLAMAYFCAGLSKLAVGGLDWFNGTTLQFYLIQDAIRWDVQITQWLIPKKNLWIAVSIGSVAFELLFPLVLVFRRLAPLFILAGLSMHLGIYIMQKAPFFQFMALYLVWVPWDKIIARFTGTPATGDSRGTLSLQGS